MSGGRADCGRVRKEKSKSGRLWGARKIVRRKKNGVGRERTADGFAEERAKMRGVATQWAPESNEWRIETHQAYGASRANARRPDADAIRRTHILFLLMYLSTNRNLKENKGYSSPLEAPNGKTFRTRKLNNSRVGANYSKPNALTSTTEAVQYDDQA